MSTTYPYGDTGHNCYKCGTWVPTGTTHSCNAYEPVTNGYRCELCGTWVYGSFHYCHIPYKTDNIPNMNLRIVEALERIADALENQIRLLDIINK
jgi:hypothetical protein